MAAPLRVLSGNKIYTISLNSCATYGKCPQFSLFNQCKRCLRFQKLNYFQGHIQISRLPSSDVWKGKDFRLGGLFSRFTRALSYRGFKNRKFGLKNICISSSSAKTDNQKQYGTSSRQKVGKDLVSRLKKENIWTIPNLLTMTRIVLTPVIGCLVVAESYTAAVALFTVAGITDLLDGYIARNFKNQMSALGTALDPLADKILMTVLTVTLTMSELMPVPLAVLIIGRDVLLVATGFIIRYISLPPPKTLKRYFDVTNPTATLHPSLLSKINTALQLSLVCFTLAAPVFGYVDHPFLQCLWYITGATTLFSGVGYVINRKKAVQFLHTNTEKTVK